MVDVNLKPAEESALGARLVVHPRLCSTGAAHFLCQAVFPRVDVRPGKSSGLEHSVPLDPEGLYSWVQVSNVWELDRSPREPRLDPAYATFLDLFEAAAARSQLEVWASTPRGLRRGGPCLDWATQQRSLAGIQLHLDWRSWANSRRHERSCLPGLHLLMLPVNVLQQHEQQLRSAVGSFVSAFARRGVKLRPARERSS